MDGENLLKNITANALVYEACADSKAALIKAVRNKR